MSVPNSSIRRYKKLPLNQTKIEDNFRFYVIYVSSV